MNVAVDNEEINLVELIHKPTWKTVLLDLVRKNKMDPWDIDICLLSQKYLEKIQNMQERNLRIPANAILAASILLRYKAYYIKISSLKEFEELEFMSEEEKEKLAEEAKKLAIDFELPTLVAPKLIRRGAVALDDLVSAIEAVLKKHKRKRLLAEINAPKFQIPIEEASPEEKLNELYDRIKKTADEEGFLRFSELTRNQTIMEKAETFIYLLLLSHQQKLNIWQEEFFGEIFIALL
ncbi:MAG: hypothetical protein DRO04_00850 [Candidatus Iainarchaeum archaeon]|uniref:Segregation/condensation protein A n=1 Tax=Candidatus Iainarchaeum sp. TaxID=3101447 RepID=A0A497JHS2_9ARCH|nr:MAG: hypothetical protein DRO04_00850 [Candidatus Diapherotrites archaeon]